MHFQCPKLTPLQSRFAASVVASAILVVIYFSLSNPHFAYAAELELDGSGQPRAKDHNWHRIEEQLLQDELSEGDKHSGLGRRQETATALANNEPGGANGLNINAGDTQLWVFPTDALYGAHGYNGTGLFSDLGSNDTEVALLAHAELKKREDGSLQGRQSDTSRTVWISMNTCLQPSYNGSGLQSAAPPQLTLYVGQGGNSEPGPDSIGAQMAIPLDEGFANYTLEADSDTHMAVHAPGLPSDFSGGWNYQLAASIDYYYFQLNSSTTAPFLYLVDTDTDSALLVTGNLTTADQGSAAYNKYMSLTAPFSIFATYTNNTRINGLSNSYCGLQNANLLQSEQADPEGITTNIQTGMITRGLGNYPKEQFYITSLNGSSSYIGILALDGNSTDSGPGVVGGGGKVWQPANWTTKSDGNCALLFNLTFCSEVAYAVPSNPNTFPSIDNLREVYDNYSQTYYQNFDYSLQQIPCNTTSSAQYSLAKNCTDCAAAYKQWLCAVTIPRCEDYSSPKPWLQPRNMAQPFFDNSSASLAPSILNAGYVPMTGAPTLDGSPAYIQTYASAMASNSSRNPAVIDQQIMPGPYKEVLPCEDLCYSIVQSCPASFAFSCPYPGRGLEVDYGKRAPAGSVDITCSYLGAVYVLNGAGVPSVPVGVVVLVALGLAIVFGFV